GGARREQAPPGRKRTRDSVEKQLNETLDRLTNASALDRVKVLQRRLDMEQELEATSPRPRHHPYRVMRPHKRPRTINGVTDAGMFLDELGQRGSEPLLRKVSGQVRFDLVDGNGSESWLVAVDEGQVTVS